MIHKYQQWLEESEKMEASDPSITPTTDVSAQPTDPTIAPTTGDPDETQFDAANTPVPEPTDSMETTKSEIEQYHELDQIRRDSIKAFKKKQEEFLEIPDETRKNPVEETDKTKVDTLKSELIELNKTMKDAISAWQSFNAKALGIDAADLDDETSPNYEP